MKKTCILFSDEFLKLETFIQSLFPLPIVLEDIGNGFHQGRYGLNGNQVWIYEDQSTIENYKEENRINEITSVLGTEAKSSFILEANSGEQSDLMLREILRKFSENHNFAFLIGKNELISSKKIL